MSGFLNLQSVLVPRKVLTEGQDFLRAVGSTGREGMVLWIGTHEGSTFTVTNLVIPKQRGLITADGVCVIVDPDELRKLNLELYRHNLRLIAQVHSHPGRAFHSDTDDEYAIARTIGALSLVIPDFAVRPFSLNDCATYRLSARGSWDHISSNAASRLIQVFGEGYYGAC
jgi:hypothetical protein